MSLLETEHLCISFGGLKAVDDVNIELKDKELIGLIGPNGAGKTTLFNLLTGVYKPTSGAVKVNGADTEKLSTPQIINLGLARTFQKNDSPFKQGLGFDVGVPFFHTSF